MVKKYKPKHKKKQKTKYITKFNPSTKFIHTLRSKSKKNIKIIEPKNIIINKHQLNPLIFKNFPLLLKPKKQKKEEKEQKKNKNERTNFEAEKIMSIISESEGKINIKCVQCSKNIYNQIKIILFFDNTINEENKSNFKIICINCFIIYFKNKSNNQINEKNKTDISNFINYKIIDKLSDYPSYENWNYQEEFKFLGAIEKFGLENWEEISNILGRGITECSDHYYTYYYKSNGKFLPQPPSKKKKHKKNYNTKPKNNFSTNYFSNYKKNALSNRTVTCNNNNNFENVITEENQKILTDPSNYLGYMPKRNEFEYEFKNCAELELTELEFNDDDSEEMIILHNEILKHYNEILIKREERKKFIMEDGIFDIRKQISFEKKLSKEDKEIYRSLKQYLRYLHTENFSELYKGILLYKNLQIRINQLKYFQNEGCNYFEDIKNFLAEKQNQEENSRKVRISLSDMCVNLNEKSTIDE